MEGSEIRGAGASMAEGVRVKRELDVGDAVSELPGIWEQRFHQLAALAFSHGVTPEALAEIEQTGTANERAECSTLRLGKRVCVPGKDGMGSVRFAGKTPFADSEFLGIDMDQAALPR